MVRRMLLASLGIAFVLTAVVGCGDNKEAQPSADRPVNVQPITPKNGKGVLKGSSE